MIVTNILLFLIFGLLFLETPSRPDQTEFDMLLQEVRNIRRILWDIREMLKNETK